MEIKRKINNPKWVEVTTCQGNPFYYQYKTWIGAYLKYLHERRRKEKYHTMNFKVKRYVS